MRVVTGTYDLYYGGSPSGTSPSAPLGPSLRLASGVSVTSAGTTTLEVDVPVVRVRGAMNCIIEAG